MIPVYWHYGGRGSWCHELVEFLTNGSTLDAMRSIERHGGAEILERTFLGFAQLPERIGISWRRVLGFADDEMPTEAMVLDHFRSRAAEAHPDRDGGDHERMVQLTSAKREALQELLVQ